MAILMMDGPFCLNEATIDQKVSITLAGNYALGHKNDEGTFQVDYIGRSDSDVSDCLKCLVKKSRHPLFMSSYAPSSKAAFEKECRNYHDFNPIDNNIHPDKPNGSNWKCPVCGL